MIPYGRQSIDEQDVAAVVEALRSDWLTTGPRVDEFEAAVARAAGTTHAVAVSSGTAALHAAMHVIDIGPGDEVVVPAMTFAATANAVVFQGGTPLFADVDPDTLLIDAGSAAARITPRTKAIVGVDYAGQPCDWDRLRALAREHGLRLIADACHSLGARVGGRPAAGLADVACFSFHPVKHVTTGEGGALVTDDPALAARARVFRNHGISTDHRQRAEAGAWRYEMVELGFNYRITDIQCALGTSQLRKLDAWVDRRRAIAARYDAAFAGVPGVEPLAVRDGAEPSWHLYPIRVDRAIRDAAFTGLRRAGIGVNVHYVPVHLHPFYRRRFGTGPGLCPVAESQAERLLSLPMFPGLSDADVEHVVRQVASVLAGISPPRGEP